jgi:hypothetical protein
MDDVLGMGVVLAEDEGLGYERATGKQFGEQRVLERLEHGADLRRDDDAAVEVLRGADAMSAVKPNAATDSLIQPAEAKMPEPLVK